MPQLRELQIMTSISTARPLIKPVRAARFAASAGSRAPALRTKLMTVLLALTAILCLSAACLVSADDETAKKVEYGDFPLVNIETSAGKIVLELDATMAPGSVENFLGYVNDGFYDGTIFHRVIDGFMIQGGGFTSEFEKKETRDPISNEANNGMKNRRYSIAMARTNAPHSATAQFFINTVDNDSLDYTSSTPRGWGYAVFGHVVDGFDVVNSISSTVTGPGGPFSRDTPQEPIVITKVQMLVTDDAEPTESTDETPKVSQ